MHGDSHLEDFENGFDATHKHLEDLGAKLAPKKIHNLVFVYGLKGMVEDSQVDKAATSNQGNHRWKRFGEPYECGGEPIPRHHSDEQDEEDHGGSGGAEQGKGPLWKKGNDYKSGEATQSPLWM